MFNQYFSKKNDSFIKVWNKFKKDSGKKKTIDYEPIVKPIREFFEGHMPSQFLVASGSAQDSFGHRVDNIDLILYYAYHAQMWEMMNKAAVIEHIFGTILVMPKITTDKLIPMLEKAASVKKLSPRQQELGEGANLRKIPITILAYESDLSYSQLKDFIINFYEKNEILNAYEVDFIVVLNHCLVIKDWHDQSKRFLSLETKKDSFMWFYILFQEYILGENSYNLGFSYREYIKEPVKYNEY